MCLTVKSKEESKLVVKCFKELRKLPFTYRTPVYPKNVTSFLLIPDTPSNQTNFRVNEKVKGGFIHASTKKQPTYKYHKIFRAFAIGVVAYGDNNDLVCKALYLPDFNPFHTSYLIQQLNKCVDVKEIYQIFPSLQGYL